MTQFQKGHQAALADIQVFIDQAYGEEEIAFPEDMRDFFENVTSWVKNNYVPKPEPAKPTMRNGMYRGYRVERDPSSVGGWSIWAGKEMTLNNYIEDASSINDAKAKIDAYLNTK